VAVLAAAGAFAVTAAATQISWEPMATRRPFDLIVRGAGWLAIAVGTAAWARGVRVRLAGLLVVLGVAFFLRDLRESAQPLVHDVGVCTAYAWTSIAAHLALAWPDGALRGRGIRLLSAACYICAVGTQLMRVLDPGSGDTWPRAGSVSAGVLTLTVVTVVSRRWWLQRDHDRPAELVVVGAIVVGLIGASVAFLNAGDDSNARMDAVPVIVAFGVVPIAVLAYVRLRAQLLEVQVSRRRALQALSEVQQSRRRIVEATVAERRRIQHDLHEGAQQGLAAVQILLWEAQGAVPAAPAPELEAAWSKVAAARSQLTEAIDELRGFVQGIYPVVLHDHGLLAALDEVARQSPIPVLIDVTARRCTHELEIAAYFCVKEAIANALKYAEASRIDVTVEDDGAGLVVRVADDGLGEAQPPWDGGLRMLQDRVEAVGGNITDFSSARGAGTSITLLLPYPEAAADTRSEEE
jgi:signal transduction histidine kinase